MDLRTPRGVLGCHRHVHRRLPTPHARAQRPRPRIVNDKRIGPNKDRNNVLDVTSTSQRSYATRCVTVLLKNHPPVRRSHLQAPHHRQQTSPTHHHRFIGSSTKYFTRSTTPRSTIDMSFKIHLRPSLPTQKSSNETATVLYYHQPWVLSTAPSYLRIHPLRSERHIERENRENL
jgi:hypothetical protein